MDDTMTFEQELFNSDSWGRWSYTPLCQAAADGDLDNLLLAIKYAQSNDYSLDADFEEGYDYHLRKGCALTEALLQGHVDCANALIDAGANVDVSCLEPDVEHPFAAFQKVEETHASLLAYSLDKKLFERILEKGCDLEFIYKLAINNRNAELINQLEPYLKQLDLDLYDDDWEQYVPPAFYAVNKIDTKHKDESIKIFRLVIGISGCPLVWTNRDGEIVDLEESIVDLVLARTNRELISELGLGNVVYPGCIDLSNNVFSSIFHEVFISALQRVDLFYDVIGQLIEKSKLDSEENFYYFPSLERVRAEQDRVGTDFLEIRKLLYGAKDKPNYLSDAIERIRSIRVLYEDVKFISEKSPSDLQSVSSERLNHFFALFAEPDTDEYSDSLKNIANKVTANCHFSLPFELLIYLLSAEYKPGRIY